MSKTASDSTKSLNFASNRCKVSAWYNGCGLNCFTHLIVNKLLTNQLSQAIMESPEYRELLHSFQEYYALPQLPQWDTMKELFRTYPVPTDREAILAPALKFHLAKLLKKSADTLWDTLASISYSEYLKSGDSADNSGPIVEVNKHWLNQARTEYLEELKKRSALSITGRERELATVTIVTNKQALTEQTIAEKVDLLRQMELLDEMLAKGKEHWLAAGCLQYLEYFGNVENAVLVGGNDLQLLGQQLFFEVELAHEGGRFNDAQFNDKPLASIRIHNQNLHWEFEVEGIESVLHNRYYPDELSVAFMADDSLSGCFKIRGEWAYENTLESVKKAIQSFFKSPTCHYSTIRKEAEQTLDELVDKLSLWFEQGAINENQQKEIFERSFELLAYELQKQDNDGITIKRQCQQVRELQPTTDETALLSLELSSLRLS